MKIDLNQGATVQIDDATGSGVYAKDGQAVKVQLVGTTDLGALKLKRPDGVVYIENGGREIRVNQATEPYHQPASLGSDIPMAMKRVVRGQYMPNGMAPRSWKFSALQRGQSRAIAAEFQPGPGAGWIFQKQSFPPAPQNQVQNWHLTSGPKLSPNLAGEETILIDEIVPTNVRVRLNSHQQYLEDGAGVAFENNLIWYLRIGGSDILNPFSTVKSGRIIRSNNAFIPFGTESKDLPILSPGTRIQYVVRNVSAAVGSNAVAASLLMTLWGDKGE